MKWVLPSLSLAAGVAYFIAATLGGKLQLGLEMFGIMVVFGAALLLFGGRSETIRGLRGDERDERFAMIDLRATAYTALVLILVIVGAFIYELARGRSGAPYFWLGALAGVTYLVSVAVLRLRS
ncbi:MAG: hypothetical protein JOZ46_03550 [Candidatus Dormibacteraeota bacterium]|nr:hypothetical protein [Candidatus Dormibacteraeota bacterium]MBV9524877.1 hypothetical protein [Candidatus Dormibacteraeota bacterium]